MLYVMRRDFNGEREELHFHWNRPGTPTLSTAWSMLEPLSLDLLTTANRRRGSMTIHRAYSDRPLQLDVNLISTRVSSDIGRVR